MHFNKKNEGISRSPIFLFKYIIISSIDQFLRVRFAMGCRTTPAPLSPFIKLISHARNFKFGTYVHTHI